jgi:hypothetical protein
VATTESRARGAEAAAQPVLAGSHDPADTQCPAGVVDTTRRNLKPPVPDSYLLACAFLI